jgi:apoptotic chromatin condensation inducer in the nucleus
VTLDDLFRKTKAKPHLNYLPLTDEQVAEKQARREARAAAGIGGRGAGREPVGPAVQEGIAS